MCPIEDGRYLTFPDVNVVERHAFLRQYFVSTIDVPYNRVTASRLSFVVLFVPFLLGIMFNNASIKFCFLFFAKRLLKSYSLSQQVFFKGRGLKSISFLAWKNYLSATYNHTKRLAFFARRLHLNAICNHTE